MKVIIEVVPHITQRYNTIGDWQKFGDTLSIKVSDLGDWKKEMLVAIHELTETLLCMSDGVSEEEVDKFDIGHPELHEPGDSVDAPYHEQHKIALEVETIVMNGLHVDQEEYENKMEDLQNDYDAYKKVIEHGDGS